MNSQWYEAKIADLQAKLEELKIDWDAVVSKDSYDSLMGENRALHAQVEALTAARSRQADTIIDYQKCVLKLEAALNGLVSIIPHQHCRTCQQYAREAQAALQPAQQGSHE